MLMYEILGIYHDFVDLVRNGRILRGFDNSMINLKLEKLEAGMILAKAVYNHQELLLLEAGAKLTEKHIRMFKSWGVYSIWVKGDCPDANSDNQTSKAESAAAIEIELDQKFADVIDNPIMAEIKLAAGRVLCKHLEEQGEDE